MADRSQGILLDSSVIIAHFRGSRFGGTGTAPVRSDRSASESSRPTPHTPQPGSPERQARVNPSFSSTISSHHQHTSFVPSSWGHATLLDTERRGSGILKPDLPAKRKPAPCMQASLPGPDLLHAFGSVGRCARPTSAGPRRTGTDKSAVVGIGLDDGRFDLGSDGNPAGADEDDAILGGDLLSSNHAFHPPPPAPLQVIGAFLSR